MNGNPGSRTLHLNIVALSHLEEALASIALHLDVFTVGLEGHLHYGVTDKERNSPPKNLAGLYMRVEYLTTEGTKRRTHCIISFWLLCVTPFL